VGSSELERLTARIVAFRDERDWKQFHNPKDIAVSISLEAAELLELTQWKNGQELQSFLETKRADVGDELSDILYWVLLLAYEEKIDLATAFEDKMRKNEAKYPIAKAKGSAKKYSEL
jgi:NTP pyrophosphatase (non-canonical NTP hydrolase)